MVTTSDACGLEKNIELSIEIMTDSREIEDYVVVGAGTAGLIAALYLKNVAPKKKITVLSSERPGLVGAGEGTVPMFIELMDFLGIPVSRLVKDAGATMKNGTRFVNWNGGGDSDVYWHPFNSASGVGISDMESREYINSVHPGFLMATSLNTSPDEIELPALLSRSCKVGFVPEGVEIQNMDPIYGYRMLTKFALHFDAVKLAEELTAIAKSRNIEFVEGILESCERDETGDVKTLVLESGKTLKADFIFDTSGFKSFFPQEVVSEWVSHKEHLPVNAAIPFSLPVEEKLPAYTDAIAMKYGWMWKAPLQHRYGCGYAFDSSLITAEEAQAEVEEYLGHEIEVGHTLNFEPGYYKNPWRQNVIAVGLAAGFIEPLESTSMASLIMQLKNVLAAPDQMITRDPRVSDLYNKKFASMSEEVASLINFHYLTGRDDTAFWRKVSPENTVDRLMKKLDLMEYKILHYTDDADIFWTPVSWYYVGFGINYKPLLDAVGHAEEHSLYAKFHGNEYRDVKKTVYEMIPSCMDHRTFLENIGAKKWES
jgi:tryptophan halogenase